jgi:hypothetical protein
VVQAWSLRKAAIPKIPEINPQSEITMCLFNLFHDAIDFQF